MQIFILLCGLSAVLYGVITSRQILSQSSGNDKMQEIARAIQEGAKAYLNRQYLTISIVGTIIFVLIWLIFDVYSAIGFLIGAFFSGAALRQGIQCHTAEDVERLHGICGMGASGHTTQHHSKGG